MSSTSARDAEAWEKVVAKLRTREMPPPGRPRPDAATYAAVDGGARDARSMRPPRQPATRAASPCIG